eukprot:5644715-Pleurochrysis_carterae.AAC.5
MRYSATSKGQRVPTHCQPATRLCLMFSSFSGLLPSLAAAAPCPMAMRYAHIHPSPSDQIAN